MKKHLGTILIILILLTGLSLFLYPTVSNLISNNNSSKSIGRYSENVSDLPGDAEQEELRKAEEYNSRLFQLSTASGQASVSASDYDYLLNIAGDGMMCYVDIPKINCRLPVYHGTDAETLESYIGHLSSSSLPVGGESTHCVLTGHTGMPSAKLLSDLDSMESGDRFTVTTLHRKLTYEVDNITVVLPNETEALEIIKGEDYCTLVTCTPYGINTHRLLVRGRRVQDAEPEVAQVSLSFIDELYSNPVMISLAVLLILLMITYAVTRRFEYE